MKLETSLIDENQAGHAACSHDAPATGASLPKPVTQLPARAARGVRRAQEHGPAGIAPSPVSGLAYPWLRTGSVDVEILINWAFGPQRVDANPYRGLNAIERLAEGCEPDGHSADGCWAIEQRHMIGATIDSFGAGGNDDPNPIAQAVGRAVAHCGNPGLMRHWARVGIRPDGWKAPAQMIVPRYWKSAGESGEWEHTGANGKSIFTPVLLARSAAGIEMARVVYADWHRTLVELWLTLSSRALPFVVMPPAAPAEPWARADTTTPVEPVATVAVPSGLVLLPTDETFDTVTAAAKPTLVLFVAAWCIPSRGMVADIDALARMMASVATVAVVDVAVAQAVAVRAELVGLPTVALYRSGRKIAEHKPGSMRVRALRNWAVDALKQIGR